MLSGVPSDRRWGVGCQECRAQGLCSWPKELIDSTDYFVWEPHCALLKAVASGREGGAEANLALSLPLETLITGNRSQLIQLRNRGVQCLKPVVSGCDLPSCTRACSQQVLGVCSGAVWCFLAASLWAALAWQPRVAGRGRMGAEQLAGLFGKTVVLD